MAATLGCVLLLGCSRGARCGTCGMKVDGASPWVAYVAIDGRETPFDTPRCALSAWRGRESSALRARFREYYSRELRPASDLLFVAGSDVVGPMGPDLVPVEASRARRFALDHNGAPPKTLDELRQGQLP